MTYSPSVLYSFVKTFLLSLLTVFIFAGCDNQEKIVLQAGLDATFPPYSYYQDSEIAGIDPDILHEIARRNNCELIIHDMNFNSVIAAVQIGKIDFASSGITVTEERKKSVNFSIPYIEAGQVIIMRKSDPIATLDDLRNLRIGVQHGSTGDQYVTQNIKEPHRYEDASLTISSLLAQKIDTVVLDNVPAKVFVQKNPSLTQFSTPLTSEQYAIAVNKNKTDLLTMVNKTLEEMKNDGKLQQIIDSHMNKDYSDSSSQEALSGWDKLVADFKLNFVENKRYMYIIKGFGVTLLISAGAILMGIFIGFWIAIIRSTADRTGKLKFLNLFCKFYLTVIRGTPVVVQLLIIYFVIFGSVDINKILVAIIAFGLNSGAYIAEIIRSGINSIDRGQFEASRSLGLSYPKTIVFIILPQALKNVLPTLGNEFIVLLKETSVSGYIAIQDLTKGGDIIRSQTYNAFFPLLAVAIIYLIVVVFFSRLLNKLEKKLNHD